MPHDLARGHVRLHNWWAAVLPSKISGWPQFLLIWWILRHTTDAPRRPGTLAPRWTPATSIDQLAEILRCDRRQAIRVVLDAERRGLVKRDGEGGNPDRYCLLVDNWLNVPDYQPPKEDTPPPPKTASKVAAPLLMKPGTRSQQVPLPIACEAVRCYNQTPAELSVEALVDAGVLLVSIRAGDAESEDKAKYRDQGVTNMSLDGPQEGPKSPANRMVSPSIRFSYGQLNAWFPGSLLPRPGR